MGFFILNETCWTSVCCALPGADCEPCMTGNVSSPPSCSGAYVHILCGMLARHCCLLLKGLLRSMNVMFPSPRHSVTHKQLIALAGCGDSCLRFVCWNKGMSWHVNNFEEGYKASSYEVGTITKYHGR